ncbi:22066_t:CDS:2, partial [Racocetra persica]
AKAYKNMHPYGQGILGVLHAAKNNHPEIKDYIHRIDWAKFYKTPWIISSLNMHMSKMEHDIWKKHNNNTNSAEAAHALVNKEGKQLKLLSAILR